MLNLSQLPVAIFFGGGICRYFGVHKIASRLVRRGFRSIGTVTTDENQYIW